MTSPRISIVIPTFNRWDMTSKLLLGILQYCSPVHEVIIANNGSTDDWTRKGIEWWKEQEKLPIRPIHAKENVGFLKIANMAVAKAEGDIIILINNDVIMQADVVMSVKALLSTPPKKIVGNILYDYDTGWNKFGKKLFPYLGGYLLGFEKSAWDEIDGFDERYSPCDFEDVDFSTTALSCGYTLVPLNDLRIHHLSGQTLTYGPEREKLTKKNQKKFASKWNANKWIEDK